MFSERNDFYTFHTICTDRVEVEKRIIGYKF
jgi:hypothetical protein